MVCLKHNLGTKRFLLQICSELRHYHYEGEQYKDNLMCVRPSEEKSAGKNSLTCIGM